MAYGVSNGQVTNDVT